MNLVSREDTFSLFTLLFSIVCMIVAFQYPADSSGFPRAIATLLMLLAVSDIIRAAVARRKTKRDTTVTATIDRRNWSAALLVLASAPIYVLLARLFDFEIATFVYLAAGMYMLGDRNPILIVSVSVGVMIAVKALFFVLLDVTRTSTLIFGT